MKRKSSLLRSLTRRTLTLGFAALVVLALGGNANAGDREIRYRDRISGTAAPSSFDVNGDGIPGHYVTFAGRSNLGLVNGGMLVEYDFPNVGPDPACSAGTLGVPILASAGSRALTLTGGQLFMRDDHATALFCLEPTTGAFTMSLKGTIEGGMGSFEGASGTYAYEGSGRVLLQDASPAMLPFGPFEIRTEGTIVVPRRSFGH